MDETISNDRNSNVLKKNDHDLSKQKISSFFSVLIIGKLGFCICFEFRASNFEFQNIKMGDKCISRFSLRFNNQKIELEEV